ncbi:hypothetical protein TGME49_316510 [Toxoplasma gondii ME49]|uniref:C3H1-type domain-containing protein n=3 Tax=Toxoplasma gondii TaxID=5811 RepID=B6K9U2_TOXGV|nr:hypothetical protein TGME49_316510 [Toxoplasma gondii ME49]EPT25646.1 hypothetical protein TGME49_316510 [Toxoplasma gondii ME49]ESS35254.1 hypothetical protein TGVEG_316510 [Toxoplasma gondii VEG]KFG36643.1 hypothetical protein TGDOM2_316510 [Toxoplasma gondii GAB2-2007-GAL-DOM2]CEL77832.1 TPA: hypothetical protein BN1205_101610 [Toxoplasma gondii VEG]|eukprot:XP_002364816.1 hypothetical protein TGME49_316510 [Toxoplasma gondii ME49]
MPPGTKAGGLGPPRRVNGDFDEHLTGDHDAEKEERSRYPSPSSVQASELFSGDAGSWTPHPFLSPAVSTNAEPASPRWTATLSAGPGSHPDSFSPDLVSARSFSVLAQKDEEVPLAAPEAETATLTGLLPSLLLESGFAHEQEHGQPRQRRENRAAVELGEGTVETVVVPRHDAWVFAGENEGGAPRLADPGKDGPAEEFDGGASPACVECVCDAVPVPLRSEQTAPEETKAENEPPHTYGGVYRKGLTRRRGARHRSLSRQWNGETRGSAGGRPPRDSGSPPSVDARKQERPSEDGTALPLNDLLRLLAITGPPGLQPHQRGPETDAKQPQTVASGQPSTLADLASFSTFLESLLTSTPRSLDVGSTARPGGTAGTTPVQGDGARRQGNADGVSGEKDNQNKISRELAIQPETERSLAPPRDPDAGHQPPLGADARPRKGRDADLDAVYKTKICPFVKSGRVCPKALGCTFAHASAELRTPPDSRVTNAYRCDQRGGGRGDRYKFAPKSRKLSASPEVSVSGGRQSPTAKTSCFAPKETRFSSQEGECVDGGVIGTCAGSEPAAEEEVFRHLDGFFSALSSHCGGSTPLLTEDENGAVSGLSLCRLYGSSPSSSGNLSLSVASSALSRTVVSGSSLDSAPPGSGSSFGVFPALEALGPLSDAQAFPEGEDGHSPLSTFSVLPAHLRGSSDATADYEDFLCHSHAPPSPGFEAHHNSAGPSLYPSPSLAVAPVVLDTHTRGPLQSRGTFPGGACMHTGLLKRKGTCYANAGVRKGLGARDESAAVLSPDVGANRGDRSAAMASQGLQKFSLARSSTTTSIASDGALPTPVTASKTRRGKRGGRRKRGGRGANARRANPGRGWPLNGSEKGQLGGRLPADDSAWAHVLAEALASGAVLPESLASALVAMYGTGDASESLDGLADPGFRRRQVCDTEERLHAVDDVDGWGQYAPLWLRPEFGVSGMNAQAHEDVDLASSLHEVVQGSRVRSSDEGPLGNAGGARGRDEDLRGQSQKPESAIAAVSSWVPLGGVVARETVWPDASPSLIARSGGKGAPGFTEDSTASWLDKEGTEDVQEACVSNEKACARLLLLQCLQEVVSRLPALNSDELRCLTSLLKLQKTRETFCK